LDSIIVERDKEIKRRKATIRSLEKDASKVKELQAELQALRALQETYDDRIDSFMTANRMLQEEIVVYKAKVDSQSQTITQQQQKISKGSIISSDKIVVTPQRKKSNGKLVPTSIAAKTSNVKICFNLQENKIADPGPKTVHLQVMKQGGEVLGTDASTFEVKDDSNPARYSTATTIEYQNRPETYCTDWKYDLVLTKGEYTVKAFTDGYFSGAGVFILK
jgi:hypothetical protein